EITMRKMLILRVRFSALLIGLLTMATLATLPFYAQQPPPFDEPRMVADLTNQLQLTLEQTATLSGLLKQRRPRFDGLMQQMSAQQPGSPQFNELRGQMERERRAMLEEFLPSLRPEQQIRLRGLIANMPPNGPGGPPPPSAIQPLKPILPPGALSVGERLIPQPSTVVKAATENARSRRASGAISSLTDDQKVLHLLNRAGFGPRPGDIERIKRIGIEQYLSQQLHPEDLTDDFLDRPLQALNTMQMTSPEIAQNFLPPPPRLVPTPTPTPALKKDAEMGGRGDAATGRQGEAEKDKQTEKEMAKPGEPGKDVMAAPPQMVKQEAQPKVETGPRTLPQPVKPPVVDTQRPLRELQQAKLLRAIFSEKQLQEVMVDFWFNHFNVFAGKDNARLLLTSYERDVIRPHALGKFKDLLVATAQSPAMLYYLDNFMSQVEMPAPPPKMDADGNPIPAPRRPGLNENYGRELMELHTLGVDGGYTQKDVQEMARCFTGWTLTQQPNWGFVFRPRIHDKGEKVVLGKRIAPGGGIEDGLRVLDLLAKHPSTAKFISRKLVQRFVADEPSQSLVDRMAEVFTRTDGDIREVVRAVLTSPDFYSPKSYQSKIKSPLELAASAIRATGASTDGAQPLAQVVARMGEPLYQFQPPTGYSEDSSRWLSNATLLERMNFAVALVGNRINGTRVDVARLVTPDALKQQDRLLDQLVAALIHSDVSKETRDNLNRVLSDQRTKLTPAKFDDRTAQKSAEQAVSALAALVLGAREFQVK
ncbi:MAG: DUF1800 domain-containing protein, partial [Acidobacteriota bacterium]|nr:DUF1800 domain-containing protein [Acidobacteriota bacterium]